MKRLMITAAIAAATFSAPVFADNYEAGQPGYYGRLDVSGYPTPPVVYAQPKVIGSVPMDREPIYMRVPTSHAKHWEAHCQEYSACGEKVFFVKNSWYGKVYASRYQKDHLNSRKDSMSNRQGTGNMNNRQSDAADTTQKGFASNYQKEQQQEQADMDQQGSGNMQNRQRNASDSSQKGFASDYQKEQQQKQEQEDMDKQSSRNMQDRQGDATDSSQKSFASRYQQEQQDNRDNPSQVNDSFSDRRSEGNMKVRNNDLHGIGQIGN